MMTSIGMVGVCSALFLLGHDDQCWYGGCVFCTALWAMMTSVGMVGVCSALCLMGHDDQCWNGWCVFCSVSYGP